METLEAIHTRRSVRSFKAEPVPLDLVRKIVELSWKRGQT